MYKYRFHIDRNIKLVDRVFKLKAKVWVYSGLAAWHFVTVPKVAGKTIRKRFGFSAKGWGSLPVLVKVGEHFWNTSIFPDKKSGSYLLPLKTEIRKKVNIKKGDSLSLSLTVR